MRLKKRHKAGRMRGSSTHGWGSRKKHLGSGHRGGVGMAGTGKKAGQKITFISKYYGTDYFGKKGFTSRKSEKKRNKVMNLGYISENIESLKKKFGNKEGVLDLKGYKILGDGELNAKVMIKAESASASAVEKIEKAGGKIVLAEKIEKKEGQTKAAKPALEAKAVK